MPERGLEDYASPILRASVFRRIYPGAQISYSVVAIEDAFPMGHAEYEGQALEAVRCEIIFADGTYIVSHKEMDLKERGKGVSQTPEQLAKDETKALGRALRDAGIPQRLSELKILMQWYPNVSRETSVNTSSPVRPPLTTGAVGVQEQLSEAFPGSVEVDDSADAGADEPTPEQRLGKRFALLDGPIKAQVVGYARENLGCSNVLRAGEHVDALDAYIDAMESGGPTAAIATPQDAAAAVEEVMPPGVTKEMREEAEATSARHAAKRAKYQQPPEPDEEPF